MPSDILTALQDLSAVGVLVVVVVYLLVKDRGSKRPLNNGSIARLEASHREAVQAFRQAADQLHDTAGQLNTIHEDMRENNSKMTQVLGLLNQITGRLNTRGR